MARFLRKGSTKPVPQKEEVPEIEANFVSETVSLELLEKELSKYSPECRVEVAAYTALNWGARHENEDRVMNARDTCGKLGFYTIGVLDGHDTAMASEAVARLLPHAVAKHLKQGKPVDQAYIIAMAETEDALKKICATAGTCVNCCTVAGRNVFCGNLGDCRAVLLHLRVPAQTTSPTAVSQLTWMSRDHKASAPDEMKRIRAAGGHVIDGRVEGLEPSRTLGDFDVKMQTRKGVVSIIPEVRHAFIGEDAAPAQSILVCATDGVWDVISGQDVCDLIQARQELATLQLAMFGGPLDKADTRPLRELAEDLVRFAVAKGSHDDCTAIVALISA